jgi:hypothetical protein
LSFFRDHCHLSQWSRKRRLRESIMIFRKKGLDCYIWWKVVAAAFLVISLIGCTSPQTSSPAVTTNSPSQTINSTMTPNLPSGTPVQVSPTETPGTTPPQTLIDGSTLPVSPSPISHRLYRIDLPPGSDSGINPHYFLAAPLPVLPSVLPVYKMVVPNVTEESVTELAQRFGIKGGNYSA